MRLASAQANATLTVDSGSANSFLAYLDGDYVGTCDDHSHVGITSHWTCRIPLPSGLTAGPHALALLSISLGIENGMASDEVPYVNHFKGVRTDGRVMLGDVDITNQSPWSMRPYLTGEWLGVASKGGKGSVPWSREWGEATGRPLTWYTAVFPAVEAPAQGAYSVLVDMTGMGRGHAFVNGWDIGRYWAIEGGGTGYPTQRLYQVPPDWLTQDGGENTLTLLEEVGSSDPSRVQLVVSQMQPMVEGEEEELKKAAAVARD